MMRGSCDWPTAVNRKAGGSSPPRGAKPQPQTFRLLETPYPQGLRFILPLNRGPSGLPPVQEKNTPSGSYQNICSDYRK
jgi:hypothetical protein